MNGPDPAPDLKRTPQSEVKRQRKRGAYDRATVDAILDGALLCHVAYLIDGAPYCTPTLAWREDDHVYWHGSSISRFLEQVAGHRACLTVTHFDGVVMARSAFHHSANYRSVMLFGNVELVTEPAAKEAALRRFMEQHWPGRWDSLRPMTVKELRATTVVRMAIDEGAAKIRSGPPGDDAEDYALPIWAGVLPMATSVGAPVPDPRNLPDVALPAHIADFEL